MNEVDLDRFGGVNRLLGCDALGRLARAHVAVVGLGGVGSWAVEALARSGVGRLTLMDGDRVHRSNINRQLPALEGEVGQFKAEVLARRIAQINPACCVHPHPHFLTADNIESFFAPRYDVILDAIDQVSIKALLITAARMRNIPILTSGGAGGRLDGTAVRVGDLESTGGDPLLRQLRRVLRENGGIPAGVRAVYATGLRETDSPEGYGTACFVTGAFGFAAAGEIVRCLVGVNNFGS